MPSELGDLRQGLLLGREMAFGYGQSHFMIGKREEQNKTISYLKALNPSDRVDELAKMLSGNSPTEIARKNALELIKTIAS